ncbi:MAG: hypothetical protein R3A44_12610 [Caldilineaceae bacterium]
MHKQIRIVILSITLVYTTSMAGVALAEEKAMMLMPLAVAASHEPQALAQSTDWPTYHAADLHIRFAYPPDWRVEHVENTASSYPTVVMLYPPTAANSVLGKIEIDVQTYEIGPAQPLTSWLDSFIVLANQGNPMGGRQSEYVDVTSADLRRSRAPEQVLHVVNVLEETGPFNQTIWLTRGRLIYLMNGYSLDPAMTEIMAQIARSLVFDADAPTTLDALYGAHVQSQSVEESLAELGANRPTPATCDLACRDTRAAAAQPLSLWAQFMAWLRSWMPGEHLVDGAPPQPLLVHTPTAPPTLTASPLPTVVQPPGTYRGPSIYPGYPDFALTFDAEAFEVVSRPLAAGLTPSPLLVEKNQPDCYLRLDMGPMGAEKLTDVSLAGREWSLAQSGTPGLTVYSTLYQGGAYFFGVQTPDAATAAAQSECRQQLEAVIDSFTILSE